MSYARANRALVEPLAQSLRAAGASLWIDAADIPPASQWRQEIEQAIGRSAAVVCLISPEYVSSEICIHEMNFAHACGKRVVPVIVAPLGDRERNLPKWVQSINWLFVEPDHEDLARRIVHTAHANLGWAREHARLLVRAKEWDEHDRPRSRLLKGRDIAAAEASLTVGRAVEDPQPVQLQREFVAASRRARSQFLIVAATLAAIVAVTSLVLSVVAVRQRDAARRAERQAELSLSRSNFERFASDSSNVHTLRDAAGAAIASHEAGLAAELPATQAVASMLSVASDGTRPIAQYVGRADSQQYSGGEQGMAVSGDGSTMAYLALTGQLEVVDLWTLRTRLSTSAIRRSGALTEQIALSQSGDRLLYAGVDFQWAGGDSPATYTAMVAAYDIATQPPVEVFSGAVELDGGIFALAFGPGAKIVMVGEDGRTSIVDTSTDPWRVETLGESVLFAAADYGTARFSVDGSRLCAGGPISGFYELEPLRLITATPGVGCVPESCGGSAANRIELAGEANGPATCVDPQGRVVSELTSCPQGCALARGLESTADTPLVAVPAKYEVDYGPSTFAVPGPGGPYFVIMDNVGVIRIFASDREGVLASVESFGLPERSLAPSGQPDRGRRVVAEDGTLLEVGLADEPAELGRPGAGAPSSAILAAHLVGDGLAVITGDDDYDYISDEGERVVEIWPRDGTPRPLDVGSFDAFAFRGELAAFAGVGEIQLWNLAEERRLQSLPVGDAACAVAISPSRTALAAVTCPGTAATGTLHRWNLEEAAPRLIDEAELAFSGVSALAISDDGNVAAVAHRIGQIEVRANGVWVQPVDLMTEPVPTNDYHTGWATVDRTGQWLVTRRHLEGIKLWLIAEGNVAEVAQLLPDSNPIEPPTDVAFDQGSLSLTWSTGPGTTAGSVAAWDLSAEWALRELCPVLGDGDTAAQACPDGTRR